MLAVSPLTSVANERESQFQGFPMEENEVSEFARENLLDSINFDDIFVGVSDGDLLPDLEMDGEIFTNFSGSADEKFEPKTALVKMKDRNNSRYSEDPDAESGPDVGFESSAVIRREEIMIKSEESVVNNSSRKNTGNNRKSSSHSRNSPRKKKTKVDWTPDLHRRFVQAVEQLGLDKAVPSRIREIMGIDSLTRHNIASHLQKYRSHRKHLLAREAEVASWSQQRQMYGTPPLGGGPGKREMNAWIAPTIGFPPVTSMPHFRPLHVWGHPSVDQSSMPTWPQHIAPPPPPHAWPPPYPLPPLPPAVPPFWHSHGQYVVTTGTPCFPPHLPQMKFASPPVTPHPAMYEAEPGSIGVPSAQTPPKPAALSDVHPSKESIDAAIGDVLEKPWLPLPLGLKPPSIDTVMAELQRHGISKIPPTCS